MRGSFDDGAASDVAAEAVFKATVICVAGE
jgi:hypothetical protein